MVIVRSSKLVGYEVLGGSLGANSPLNKDNGTAVFNYTLLSWLLMALGW